MPNRGTGREDVLLQNVAVKYRSADFIADEIFSPAPVMQESDKYRIYTRDFRLPQTKRAGGASARQAQFAVTTGSYTLERHALKDWNDQDKVDGYEAADLRADTTEMLSDKILRRRERSVFELMTKTSFSLEVSLTATTKWDENTTLSNPLPVVETGLITVLHESGYEPNRMAFNRSTLKNLKAHVSILDRTKYTSADITVDMLAALFEVDKILVSKAQIDSSAEGLTEVIGPMWGDNAFLSYNPGNLTKKAPSTGAIFQKAKPRVKKWYDEDTDAEWIEVEEQYQAKVIASLTGYLISNVY